MDKQFNLYCRGQRILTCDLRGASFLPEFIVAGAGLASLDLGQEADVVDANDVVFTWKRTA